VARSDHDSVMIEVQARHAPPPSRGRASPRLRYPLPACAAEAIRDFTRAMLESRVSAMVTMAPEEAAKATQTSFCGPHGPRRPFYGD
jgi:hypothetical protein